MQELPLLIPVRRHRFLGGRFVWLAWTTLYRQEEADYIPMRQLREDLAGLGIWAEWTGSAGGATVKAVRDKSIANPEGYRLTIRPAGIELRASTAAGIYYGLQTMRDLVKAYSSRGTAAPAVSLPCLVIDDSPDFARRGVYHDISRDKVPTVDTICKLVERLAHWKINEFQLYIENVFHFPGHPDIGRGYSPLTADDIRLIQSFCKKHHVRLVGSLASFGHLERVLALPAYRDLAELPGKGVMGTLGTICPTDLRSLKLVTELYADFVPLFEAEDFNICGDETWDLGKGRSKARAERIGVGRVYLEWILKLHKLCRRHGKRMNMWADIALEHPEILPEVPRDIVMLNWEYSVDGPRMLRTGEIAAAGLPLVNCPGTHLWQSHGGRRAASRTNVIQMCEQGRRHGAEGILNTDWGDYGHRNFLGLSMMGFAHGAAHSWCSANVDERDFTRFFTRDVLDDGAGALADALTALGDHPTYYLYHALVETYDPKGYRNHGRHLVGSKEVNPADLADRYEQIKSLRMPEMGGGCRGRGVCDHVPGPGGMVTPSLRDHVGLPHFEQLSLAEFALARRMEELACARALSILSWRAGTPIPRRTFLDQAETLSAIMEDFSSLWTARNRPSRLRDNLALMRKALAESVRLGS